MKRELTAIRGALLTRGYVMVAVDNGFRWQVYMPTYTETVPVGKICRVRGHWVASQDWLHYLIQESLVTVNDK